MYEFVRKKVYFFEVLSRDGPGFLRQAVLLQVFLSAAQSFIEVHNVFQDTAIVLSHAVKVNLPSSPKSAQRDTNSRLLLSSG